MTHLLLVRLPCLFRTFVSGALRLNVIRTGPSKTVPRYHRHRMCFTQKTMFGSTCVLCLCEELHQHDIQLHVVVIESALCWVSKKLFPFAPPWLVLPYVTILGQHKKQLRMGLHFGHSPNNLAALFKPGGETIAPLHGTH